jgi:hypothetical protein
MKRIVDGLTYNTETATLLATSEWTDGNQSSSYYGCECEGELYQTRGGAFFLVTTTHIPEDRDREARDKTEFEPMTAARAQGWLLNGEVEIVTNPFDEPPEATAEEEASSTIYLRVPPAIKRDVDAAAAKAGVSVNVWGMRCIEQCIKAAKA